MDTQDELPAERITADQLVAINLRRWRTSAGITQDELGKAVGWSPANVSAAERSADPARDRRRFDAQALADIAVALGVPVAALFLPPADDGTRARYSVATHGGREIGMAEWMDGVFTHTSGPQAEDSPVREAYEAAWAEASYRYLEPEWADEVARYLVKRESQQQRADRAARLRDRASDLAAAAAELQGLASAIEAAS